MTPSTFSREGETYPLTHHSFHLFSSLIPPIKTHAITTAALVLILSLAVSTTHAWEARQVQINTKVISVPMDAALLRDAGLSLDSATGVSNLGVISTEKVAVLLAKLEKMPGVTMLSAPAIVTKSGTRATAESTREFIYPTQFDPPKLSNSSDAKPGAIAAGQIMAATPATPTKFEARRTGVSIECEPIINNDGTIIELILSPELVSFGGFVNYGSPIKAVATDKEGKVQEAILTENQIQQPVFEAVKTTTGATIPSGHCLVLGGQGGISNPLPVTGQKPDLSQTANLMQKPPYAVFFFIQAKVFTP